MNTNKKLERNQFDAVLFDMDGVITDTASTHAEAWKRLFDAYLEERAKRDGTPHEPFDAHTEYRDYVDGKPRFDGVQSFLESRGIELPWGDPEDGPDQETVCGLGNRKDGYFNAWLRENKVRVFPGTLEFIKALRAAGVRVAVFTASRNADAVLENAGVAELFDAKVDGRKTALLNLPGKPDPATLQLAASEVGVAPDRSVIVEDAIAGVQAGSRGSFAFVIGVDRANYAEALRENGADLVVNDLSECRVDDAGNLVLKSFSGLGSVWEYKTAIESSLQERSVAVLLDYDGTLTPIVTDYRKAFLSDGMRNTLRTLSERHKVAVVSGRDLKDVRRLVDLDSIYFSGSHGFELSGPGDWRHVQEQAGGYLDDLDQAEQALAEALAQIPGHAIERKRFSIAVHYRQVDDQHVDDVARIVDTVLADNNRLLKGLGKKVFELKPALQWDKGRAVELLLKELGLDGDNSIAFFIGDDITDEGAYRVLREPNVSIVIPDGDRVTAADYTLEDCDDVQRFLDWLAETGTDS